MMIQPPNKIRVAILGATGAVGQRFFSLLSDHPWFEVVAVTGSDRSIGRRFSDAVNWILPGQLPDLAERLTVEPNDSDLGGAGLVFSALPSRVAAETEQRLASRGVVVCSNASAHRMDDDVPLLIPEINPDHLAMVRYQQRARGWDGMIVTSPNCATTGLIFPLKALQQSFGVSAVHVVSMQAISGAGYPGVPAADILDNVLPHIPGEEEKLETEPCKLLGTASEQEIKPALIAISAQTHRVPVTDGHLLAFSVGLSTSASLEEVEEALHNWRGPSAVADLPSAPSMPMEYLANPDRPQPRLDRNLHAGMTVSVGRLRPCPVLDFRMISLVHNTLRGAASGAILNAEFLVAQGYLEASAAGAATSAR